MSDENIFISHIYEEAPLAKTFKEELEATSAGQWQVFVSSDTDSITLGDKWFSKIDNALTGHRLLLVLCSPGSLKRLWIGYETGYAAAKGVPIIPLCHSDTTPAALPAFLSRYQGIEINTDGFVKTLFEAIQKHVPLLKNPRIPEQEIADAIKEALAQIVHLPTPALNKQKAVVELENEDYETILKMFVQTGNGVSGWERLQTWSKMKSLRLQHCLDVLDRHDLIERRISNLGEPIWRLTATGREYAYKKGWLQP